MCYVSEKMTITTKLDARTNFYHHWRQFEQKKIQDGDFGHGLRSLNKMAREN